VPSRASSPECIQLRHPDGKRAPSIERERYALVRRLMLATVPAKAPGITWVVLRSAMDQKLGTQLGGGNNWWYTHGVKLHLEAIGELRRVGETPQRLVRAKRG
jgi:hypothetical protein